MLHHTIKEFFATILGARFHTQLEYKIMEVLLIWNILLTIFTNIRWIVLGLWKNENHVSLPVFHWKISHKDNYGKSNDLNKKKEMLWSFYITKYSKSSENLSRFYKFYLFQLPLISLEVIEYLSSNKYFI